MKRRNSIGSVTEYTWEIDSEHALEIDYLVQYLAYPADGAGFDHPDEGGDVDIVDVQCIAARVVVDDTTHDLQSEHFQALARKFSEALRTDGTLVASVNQKCWESALALMED